MWREAQGSELAVQLMQPPHNAPHPAHNCLGELQQANPHPVWRLQRAPRRRGRGQALAKPQLAGGRSLLCQQATPLKTQS